MTNSLNYAYYNFSEITPVIKSIVDSTGDLKMSNIHVTAEGNGVFSVDVDGNMYSFKDMSVEFGNVKSEKDFASAFSSVISEDYGYRTVSLKNNVISFIYVPEEASNVNHPSEFPAGLQYNFFDMKFSGTEINSAESSFYNSLREEFGTQNAENISSVAGNNNTLHIYYEKDDVTLSKYSVWSGMNGKDYIADHTQTLNQIDYSNTGDLSHHISDLIEKTYNKEFSKISLVSRGEGDFALELDGVKHFFNFNGDNNPWNVPSDEAILNAFVSEITDDNGLRYLQQNGDRVSFQYLPEQFSHVQFNEYPYGLQYNSFEMKFAGNGQNELASAVYNIVGKEFGYSNAEKVLETLDVINTSTKHNVSFFYESDDATLSLAVVDGVSVTPAEPEPVFTYTPDYTPNYGHYDSHHIMPNNLDFYLY